MLFKCCCFPWFQSEFSPEERQRVWLKVSPWHTEEEEDIERKITGNTHTHTDIPRWSCSLLFPSPSDLSILTGEASGICWASGPTHTHTHTHTHTRWCLTTLHTHNNKFTLYSAVTREHYEFSVVIVWLWAFLQTTKFTDDSICVCVCVCVCGLTAVWSFAALPGMASVKWVAGGDGDMKGG